jgi:hypothetical protein
MNYSQLTARTVGVGPFLSAIFRSSVMGVARHTQSSTLAKMRNTNPEPYILPHKTVTLFKLSHRFYRHTLFNSSAHIACTRTLSTMLLFRLLSPALTACSSCNRCRSDIISGDDCTFPLLSHLELSCHDSQRLHRSASDRVLLSPIHLRSLSVAISSFNSHTPLNILTFPWSLFRCKFLQSLPQRTPTHLRI